MPDVARGTSAKALPEVGHLVRVRDRHWVVTDLAASSLPPDVVGGEQAPSHLVSLSSVEDDGFGDELTVFWELEPATEILPQATLPEPAAGAFDPPERLAAFLDAVRWGAIASADTHALQAPFRSGITIEDYQLDPVARALRMPRANLLIADDVGLGKTIEAGLVVQELLLRHRARSVLIVCPASLCLKWQDEMRDRFGLDFRIAGSDAVKALRRERGLAANVWTSFPRLIVSIDWLKRPRAQALLDEVLPPDPARFPRTFDLLILDEAHQCAPAGRGAYATDSLRTRALQRLAPHCEHRLFLSATPSNGYTESFTALLQLLDPQRFARGVKPPPELLRRVMVRRLKSELRAQLPPKPDGTPRFAERRVLPLVVDYPEEERRIHRVLAEYTELRKRHAAGDHLAVTATEFVTLLLKKRLFSSPRAFLRTLLEHQRTLRRAGAARVTEQQLRADFDRADEDLDDDEALNEATSDALSSAARATRPLTADERARLQEMIAWAERETHRADAKARVLLDWLRRTCVPGGQWNDERVIVFTEYRDTQVWLHELLASQGVPAERVALLYGGLEADKRERIKAEFQAPPHRSPVRLLLATDAASEGIDLQLHCHRVVHVEIPFNPARLEQRNGRVDRFGQPHPTVEVYHFVGKDYERAAPGTIDGDLPLQGALQRQAAAARVRDRRLAIHRPPGGVRHLRAEDAPVAGLRRARWPDDAQVPRTASALARVRSWRVHASVARRAAGRLQRVVSRHEVGALPAGVVGAPRATGGPALGRSQPGHLAGDAEGRRGVLANAPRPGAARARARMDGRGGPAGQGARGGRRLARPAGAGVAAVRGAGQRAAVRRLLAPSGRQRARGARPPRPTRGAGRSPARGDGDVRVHAHRRARLRSGQRRRTLRVRAAVAQCADVGACGRGAG
jgi:superfamily II DNA or RNA helicase